MRKSTYRTTFRRNKNEIIISFSGYRNGSFEEMNNDLTRLGLPTVDAFREICSRNNGNITESGYHSDEYGGYRFTMSTTNTITKKEMDEFLSWKPIPTPIQTFDVEVKTTYGSIIVKGVEAVDEASAQNIAKTKIVTEIIQSV